MAWSVKFSCPRFAVSLCILLEGKVIRQLVTSWFLTSSQPCESPQGESLNTVHKPQLWWCTTMSCSCPSGFLAGRTNCNRWRRAPRTVTPWNKTPSKSCRHLCLSTHHSLPPLSSPRVSSSSLQVSQAHGDATLHSDWEQECHQGVCKPVGYVRTSRPLDRGWGWVWGQRGAGEKER